MKRLILFFISFSIAGNLSAQYWKSTGALDATNSHFYLTAATHVGETIFVVNYQKVLAYSKDLGKTWVVPEINKPKGNFYSTYLTGVKDRLYAVIDVNKNDYELYYSKDDGTNWTIDTIGLPNNITKTGKPAVVVKYMNNGYVVAHDYRSIVYKKVEETSWKPMNIKGDVIVDVEASKDKWYIISDEKIFRSADYGSTWIQLNTVGLPQKFQANKISSNGSRVFISSAPALGGNDIYYSDDEGINWTKSNAAGLYTHNNPWVQCMYAVEDYLFAAILPANMQDEAPYIISTTPKPDFSKGDVSGLPTGETISNFPFFFHVKNKLFTLMRDLYSSEPGFKGDEITGIQLSKDDNNIINVYPNPASESFQITLNGIKCTRLEIYDVLGNKVFQDNHTQENINSSEWKSGLYIISVINENGSTYKTKFIKY